jgi:hypothetical protein
VVSLHIPMAKQIGSDTTQATDCAEIAAGKT